MGIEGEDADPLARRILDGSGQRHGQGAHGVVVVGSSPDQLIGMAGGQLVPGTGSGIEQVIRLPGRVDQHLAQLRAHIDVIQFHHRLIGTP